MYSETQKGMLALILAVLFLSYSLWLYLSLPVKDKEITEEVSRGKLVWQQRNCIACHQVYGLGGYLGPDLTNIYSQKGSTYIKAFLKSGTVTMPDFQFNEVEINALIAYLRNIDVSGNADPRTFTINTDGTIEQKENRTQ